MTYNLKERTTDLLNNHSKIVNNPHSFKNKIAKRRKEVTIITPAYNAEDSIQKCIDSVLNQSFGFNKIEFIIIDDNSNDSTKDILLEQSRKHKITAVFLDENTGTAAMPRNLGIELASTDKIMFLDADDWLSDNAIENLVNVMNEADDDFVVGRTVVVRDTGESIHAEFVSYKERKHVSPFSIPYLFYHMGPPSKLIKTSLIKQNSLYFPEMKFGEDKSFLFDVLRLSTKVSTVSVPVCYVNRLTNNNLSLTRTTGVLEKRAADMRILKQYLKKGLATDEEIVLIKRLIEYDFVRTCDSITFVKSNKKEIFIDYIREALAQLEDRNYDIIEYFDSPIYQAAARLIERGEDENFEELFKWYKLDENKRIYIEDGIAYYVVAPFKQDHSYKHIPIPLFARATHSYVENQQYVQEFEIYGNKIETISYVLIRDRHNLNNEIKVPVLIKGNIGEFRVNYSNLNTLNNSLFTIFIRYDDHRLLNIKRLTENKITYKNKEINFYTSKAGNIGLSVKER